MTPTIILSTYNQPRWLALVLEGFAYQTTTDFELIVADDGSGEETARVITDMQQRAPYQFRHVWHPDNGFQKCAIMNRALAEARGSYVIFTDGDCIPTPTFVERHLALARPGRFLSGGYVKLPLSVSNAITPEAVSKALATDPRWLREQGMPRTSALVKLSTSMVVGRLLDAATTTRPTWNGHNASTWKEHLLAINGFDERLVYGGEDRELGERLVHLGISGMQVRYRIGCVHLDHPRGYVSREGIEANDAIRKETRERRSISTPFSSLAGSTGPNSPSPPSPAS